MHGQPPSNDLTLTESTMKPSAVTGSNINGGNYIPHLRVGASSKMPVIKKRFGALVAPENTSHSTSSAIGQPLHSCKQCTWADFPLAMQICTWSCDDLLQHFIH